MNPTLVAIKSPTTHDYRPFIELQWAQLEQGTGVDVVVLDTITDAAALNSVLATYYQHLRKLAAAAGRTYTFDINVLFNGLPIGKYQRIVLANDEYPGGTSFNVQLPTATTPHSQEKFGSVKVAAVGGTFDHLHDGHKILLSMARFLPTDRLIVGITGPELLKKKKHAEVMESYYTRQQSVIAFLQLISWDSCPYNIYEINDVCGPTGYVPDIDALVVSGETRSGGEFVNKTRQERGFSTVDVVEIGVIGDNVSELFDGKISSTDIREYIASH